MKWTRWLNHKNHWYMQPEEGIRLEVDGEHYRITRNGKVECEGNGHTQQYAIFARRGITGRSWRNCSLRRCVNG